MRKLLSCPTSCLTVRRLLCVLALGLLASLGTAAAQSPGQMLPARAEGGMDIHHINTGAGDNALLVFPDGTTLLVDVGGLKAPLRPNDSRPPGEWVARYIRHVHPQGEKGSLDYVVLTHFHRDHMDGIEDLARHIRIRKVLDRGWPDYQTPRPFAGDAADRYRAFLHQQKKQSGLEVERFAAGRADQIVLRHQRDSFLNFEVRNIAVNTEVWTGEGTEVRRRFPPDETPGENACSTVMRIRYGRFTYFTGGDLPGVLEPDAPEWRDMESAIAWVTGPVDVHVANHHAFRDTGNAFFLSVLQPRVHIIQVWTPSHIDPGTLERLRSERVYPGPRDIFATSALWKRRADQMIERFGEEVGRRHIAALQELTADQGHIVVRVAPGGDTYSVLVLDDSAESFRILSVHGPYESR